MSTDQPERNGVWQQRMSSLREAMQGIANALTAAQETPRQKTLLAVLNCLQTFADEQFNYVLTNPPPSKKFPQSYGVATTLSQIAYDLETIERAAHQRMFGTSNMLDTLRLADLLTVAALRPAQGSLLREGKLTALTYFQKSPSIRVIPYAPIALVGIPFSCIETPRDFLATPHEVGHYVFWHGVAPDMDLSLHSALPKKMFEQFSPDLLANYGAWMEEIFADVFGCRIAGPTVALSFQDLHLNRSQAQFETGDGDHPTPLLRPDVYTRTLRKMNRKDWADALADLWLRRKEARGYTLGDDARFNEQREEMNDVVDAALALIPPLDDKNNWWRSVYDKLTSSVLAEPEALYQALAMEVRALLPGQASGFDLPELDESLGKSANTVRRQALSEEEIMRSLRRAMPGRYQDLTDEELQWVAVLSLNGWTTEGPNAHWP